MYRNKYRSDNRGSGLLVAGALVVILAIIGVVSYVKADNTKHTRITTICTAERTATSGGGEYRVYTADTGTYAIKDSYIGGIRTNSADFYGKLKSQIPGTFRITYKHHRFGWFSWFPNMMSATKLPADQQHKQLCSS